MKMKRLMTGLTATLLAGSLGAALNFEEPPPAPKEWGFRPRENECSTVNPPPFVWREQQGAVSYDLEVSATPDFRKILYRPVCRYNVWCHSKTFPVHQKYYWRVRFRNGQKELSDWSKVRTFTIAPDALNSPMPPIDELLVRIPKTHPRLFLRPEELPELRKSPECKAYFAICNKVLRWKCDTTEVQKYPPEIKYPSAEWTKMWWGNRKRLLGILEPAAILGFGHCLGGRPEYGQEAKRRLLECAKWDPSGASSMAYNDEVGMPFLTRFSRTYTYVYDLLSEEERETCRKVMRIRGQEAYRQLYPGLFYRPYHSHHNRLWHMLGEAGVVFYNEIPEAKDWLDAAMHYYYCVYPVWGDEDGGWHEGINYWGGYMDRFLRWADILQNTFQLSVPPKPYFLNTGYYAMYLAVPGTKDGGFGDCAEHEPHCALVMKKFAILTGNPYFNWYAEAVKPIPHESPYLKFLRCARKEPPCKSPDDLPLSRLFRGHGLAVFNTNMTTAKNNVRVVFKSDPTGNGSHGFDANNSFLLDVNGERLLIRSGQRDTYGSPFHKGWMFETKSQNNVLVDGKGQVTSYLVAKGRVTGYSEDGRIGFVSGDAVASYGGRLKRFDRQLLFLRPGVLVVVDNLAAPEPVTYSWLLHTPNPFQVKDQHDVTAVNGTAGCKIDLLTPQNLKWVLTDKFDPPIRKDIKLVQSHLSFTPTEKLEKVQFIAVIRTFIGPQTQELAHYRLTEANGKKLLTVTQKGQTDKIEITQENGIVSVNGKPMQGIMKNGI